MLKKRGASSAVAQTMFSSSLPNKHKVFISFHHKDESFKNDFETWYDDHIISKSVQNGDIDPDNEDEYVKRLIQEDYLSDSSVLVALYGAETHARKHVDWEISAALSSKVGGHSGLVVMLLPSFPVAPFNYSGQFDAELLRPYLHERAMANIVSGYAKVYFWPGMYPQLPSTPMPDVLHDAFSRRVSHKHLIDNSHSQYKNNRQV